MAGGLTSGFFSGLAGGIGSIFGGIGDFAEASAYGKAAAIAQQNATLAKESGAIQEMQAGRKIFQTISGQQAEVAGAGLKQSGSAIDLYRSSVQQGALTKQLIGLQTGINVGSFEQEASAYQGMAGAAKAAGTGGILGGILGIAGAFVGLSDDTAKENIQFSRSWRGEINLYLYNFRGDSTIFLGPLASEVMAYRPECVSVDRQSGLRYVDFHKLGIMPTKVGSLNDGG